MRGECDIHGVQNGIEVSPDLIPVIKGASDKSLKYGVVRFIFDDGAFCTVVISGEFSRSYSPGEESGWRG